MPAFKEQAPTGIRHLTSGISFLIPRHVKEAVESGT